MTFAELADYFKKIEDTSSRLTITELVAELFTKLTAKECRQVSYLLQGRIAPLYDVKEFGMGAKLVDQAAIKALAIDPKVYFQKRSQLGDGGLTVHWYKQERHQKPSTLSIGDVFTRLERLTTLSGDQSQLQKITDLAQLIDEVGPLESRYLARIPANTLRLGFSDMTLLDSLSWMLTGDKSLRSAIEKAYHVYPDLGTIAYQIKREGLKGLEACIPKAGVPILMMKAERTSSPAEALEKLTEALIESKYDGFRLQIHKDGAMIKLFSRGLEDVTLMYPDIVQGVKNEVKVHTIIFEGEALGYNSKTNSFLPFQETSQRKRKYDIEQKSLEIPLRFLVFDVLLIDHEQLLQTPLEERRKRMVELFALREDLRDSIITLAPQLHTSEPLIIEELFEKAISGGLEGVMIKKVTGVYKPGARESNWIKYKRSYSSKINDTIDCVIMGYDMGKGKRSSFGIGALLVGVLDKTSEKFVTIAKVGTGLTDQEWRDFKEQLDKQTTEQQPNRYDCDPMMKPELWVNPSIVLEIKADELTRSSMHTAGRTLKPSKNGKAFVVDQSGYALRFPRLEKLREDKRPEDITTVQEIRDMFKAQIK